MSATGMLVDSEKVEVVMSWERPKSVFKIRNFFRKRTQSRSSVSAEDFEYAGLRGKIACRAVPGKGDKMLHVGRGPPRMGTAQVETRGPYPRTG